MRSGLRSSRFSLAVAFIATVALLCGVVTAPPAAAAPVPTAGARFEWQLNKEVQGAAPFGGCHYLSAGASDGTPATYKVVDGNVAILKGSATPNITNRCAMRNGSVNQRVVWTRGSGTIDPSTGAVRLRFTGKLSVNFYGGLVPFTMADPVLVVNPDGTGALTATLSGYGSTRDNPNQKAPLEPKKGVVIASLKGVDAGNRTGFTVTPRFAGVKFKAPSGATPQNRTRRGWGSWPSSFVNFQMATGLSSHWYTSGAAADVQKPPSPLKVVYGKLGDALAPPPPNSCPGTVGSTLRGPLTGIGLGLVAGLVCQLGL
jgi:hypothetical protein